MDDMEVNARISELEEQISALPKGSLVYKKINGKKWPYLQWTEGRKSKSQFVKEEELETVVAQVAQRKALQAELKELKALSRELPKAKTASTADHEFSTNVRIGKSLRRFSSSVRDYRKRECFQALHDFVYGNVQDRVFILYGLRRTGKTTLIRQILAEMSDADLLRSAFIQITAKDTLADVNRDLKYLEERDYRFIFMDEVTLMEDFIEGAALFSDVFATTGMKIVLSGTDSLGFLFAEDSQLYDRCVFLHTTFIPYREFERVLGIRGIDDYIRYGGTMSMGGVHYNMDQATFATLKSTDEYVDSAIAQNIQHSLRNYQNGGHFRHLQDLYEKKELTSAINRVIEDINHRFTLDILTRDFRSSDLGISARNLRRDRNNPDDILDRVNIESVTESLKELLEIKNRDEQNISIQDAHSIEIREYLEALDLIVNCPIETAETDATPIERILFVQPGMRYSQAKALVQSLLKDTLFATLSELDKSTVVERILQEVRGRMMEDIVLLETLKAAGKQFRVFKLQFVTGEFDMVVYNTEENCCTVYEIKHSDQVVSEQYRHLTDEDKNAKTERRFGRIKNRIVLYRGNDLLLDNGIEYRNVEEYLKSLG